MRYDYRKISRGTLARTNELSERRIFWGMIFTALVAIAMTIKGMVGQSANSTANRQIKIR
jgi:hypothetical protein